MSLSCTNRATWKCNAGQYVGALYYCPPIIPNCAGCPNGKTSSGCGDQVTCQNCFNSGSCKLGSCSNVPSTCSVGKYLRSAHRRVCVNCAAGTFKDTTSTDAEACQDCPAGKYNQHTGRSVCEACPHMHSSPVASSSSSDCFPCPDGLFADENNLCVSCPDNYILNVDGTSYANCTCANENFITFAFGMHEVPGCGPDSCASGQFAPIPAPNTTSQCQDCEAGTYKSTTGTSITECIPCEAGKHSGGAPALSSCFVCSAGSYSSTVGASSIDTCQACVAGKYSNIVGATSASQCTDCAAGTASSAGSVQCDDCTA